MALFGGENKELNNENKLSSFQSKKVNYKLIQSREDHLKFIAKLMTQKVAFDTETTFYLFLCKTIRIAFSFKADEAYYCELSKDPY